MADDLDQALAGVDFVAQDLADFAWRGGKDFLKDRCVAQPVRIAATRLRIWRNSVETKQIKTDGWFMNLLDPNAGRLNYERSRCFVRITRERGSGQSRRSQLMKTCRSSQRAIAPFPLRVQRQAPLWSKGTSCFRSP